MCTICGHFVQGGHICSSDIYDMLKKMDHRGPDTHGVYLDNETHRARKVDDLREELVRDAHIALGHSRLRIVGREQSTQPYTSCDGRLALIHNGEIYNYQKLRTLLYKQHDIKTTSDSEVIVHLLEESYRGDLVDAVKQIVGLLDGMYALAVTDGKSVVVARDPIGKKPIYYIHNGPVTYFASEKKALWNGQDEPVRLNPGELLCIDDQGPKVEGGYRLEMPQIDIVDFRQAVEEYKRVLTRSVSKRLTGLTESTLGVIFSGGIDSVLVANLLMREGKNIVCYCTGTADSADVQAAEAVAKDLGLVLKTSIIDEATVEALLPEVIENVEESGLLQVEVAIPMYLAAKMAAADGIRVMYTGQAADELFAGYPWYNDVLAEHGYLRLHEKLWEDIGMLYTDTLEREDKLTMAHSIELRAPYLDRDVILTAMRISPRLKLEGAEDNLRKRVHRQASAELGVPPYLAFRTKDPAQSGSGIHQIIQNIAASKAGVIQDDVVDKNIARDKGSLYRYGDEYEHYGESRARFYLQQIEDDIRRRFIPPFLDCETSHLPAA
ncbi:MAG: asparagine synthetase B [Desulfarculus sp.]|nr:asparagine synthetase B [Pseudomonadota bacterium]MBU4598654.1 asparagine synthetase B [Pseudomonadota bacterium]MBV1718160.1 asparagine synthetase B [Desulfarculus sp.]MBV1738768.1 asparagine synthetase B [Desulfarculus sp.]